MAELYVFIQFLSLILLVLSAPFLPENIVSFMLYLMAGIVGAFALAAMRRSKLRVSPKVHHDAQLITTGIYRFIRHPMYLAVILGALGMLMNQVTILRGSILLVLVCDLMFKILYEEHQLSQKFGTKYKAYKENTKAIIPFLL